MIAIVARKCMTCMPFYDCRENVLGEHAAHAHVARMRTIVALIAVLLVLLVSSCALYIDDEPDVDAGALDAAPALDAITDAPADACVCEPHWPACPTGCEAPAPAP